MRIAVTGVGIVSPLGFGAKSTFDALASGARAIRPVSLFDVRQHRSRLAGQVALSTADVAPRGEADSWSRTDAMAVLAAREALEASGLRREARLSVVVGGTTGGMFEAEGVLPALPAEAAVAASARRMHSYPLSTTAARIAANHANVQATATVCSACSSGANAILQGAAWILSGAAERVLAGGADGLCELTFNGFNALMAMDPEPCRPFDRTRAGMNLGEGASFLLLESEQSARARGAPILAWLSGWASGAEAHHITQPEPTGATAARLMSAAIARAGLSPAGIDYVNAHGTGTIPNDLMETLALRAAFGAEIERVRVSSSKGQIGHTLGAAGAIEAAITVLAIVRGEIPPTGGLAEPEEATELRHVIGRAESLTVRAALSNSFGFGGSDTVLAFEHAEAPRRSAENSRGRCVVSGAATFGPLGRVCGDDNVQYVDGSRSATVEFVAPDVSSAVDPRRSRRFDRPTTLLAVGVEAALGDAELAPAGVGLVTSTAYGNVERSVRFIRAAKETGRAPPAEFPHLVPSAPSGNVSIYAGLTGPVMANCDLATSADAAVQIGFHWLALTDSSAIVAGGAETLDDIVREVLGPMHGRGATAERGEGGAWLVVEREDAARARGRRPMAVIAQCLQLRADDPDIARVIGPPRNAERAHVVIGSSDVGLAEQLERIGWSNIRRVGVQRLAGFHEAVGAFALCAGAALVSTGEADHVLVVSTASGKSYLTVLVGPGTPA